MSQHKIKNALKINKTRCIIALIFSIIMFVSVCIGVVRNILAQPDEFVQEVGIKTFRMFTVLSNILIGSCAFLSIPFEIEGLRRRDYHLPNWIVELIFVGGTGVALTFIITLTVLGPYAGYDLMLFKRSNLFLHTICPILSILLIIFVNDDHTISFKASLLAFIPIIIYSILYMILAIFIGEERGGWRDHYRFNHINIGSFHVPWPLVLIVVLLLVFGITTLIRIAHNKFNELRKERIKKYYLESEEFNYPTITEAIVQLAKNEKIGNKKVYVHVPVKILKMMEEKYQSNKPINELCNIYIDEFMKD